MLKDTTIADKTARKLYGVSKSLWQIINQKKSYAATPNTMKSVMVTDNVN